MGPNLVVGIDDKDKDKLGISTNHEVCIQTMRKEDEQRALQGKGNTHFEHRAS
jgi:hypothetical protein